MAYNQILLTLILGSSAVERSAVNRLVVGSNPTRGVKKNSYDSITCKLSSTIFGVNFSRSIPAASDSKGLENKNP